MYLRILCVLIMLLPLFALAGTETKSSAWLMSLSRFEFSKDFRGFLDVQPRFAIDDISGGNDGKVDTVLFRGALGYQLTPNIGLYQGYAYIPTYNPRRIEHRSFQELLAKQPFNNGSALLHRVRFEQRFIDKVDDAAYRLRYFIRFTYPLKNIHQKLSLAMNEEVFVNLNDASDGLQSGFNQNRLFLGVNYRVNNGLAFDLGYQNQFVNRTNASDNVMNHILFLGVLTNFSFLGH